MRVSAASACMMLLQLAALGACVDSQYIGFDSRLTTRLIARFPPTESALVDFHMVSGRPVVLLKDRLLLYGGAAVPREIPVTAASAGEAFGLSVDQAGKVRLQRGGDVYIITADSLSRDPGFLPEGKLFGSGKPVLLEARKSGRFENLTFNRGSGDTFPIASLEGDLRAAFWGSAGMAAVVGKSLFVWSENSEDLNRLALDTGLERARGVCLTAAGQAVVTLLDSVALVTAEDQIMIVGMRARCDASQGRLYLADDRSGEIWEVSGLEKLGILKEDERHAADLLKGLPSGIGRKLGCLSRGSPDYRLRAREALACIATDEVRTT